MYMGIEELEPPEVIMARMMWQAKEFDRKLHKEFYKELYWGKRFCVNDEPIQKHQIRTESFRLKIDVSSVIYRMLHTNNYLRMHGQRTRRNKENKRGRV